MSAPRYVTTKHSRTYYRDPLARVVPHLADLISDRCAQLLEARRREAKALAVGNRSDARYCHITVVIWENWFLELDSMQGGNV